MAASRNSPQLELIAAVRGCLERHHLPGLPVVAGLSGGIDSVVMLWALREVLGPQGTPLSALHVHHGLSPNADDWAAFCGRICESWSISLAIRRVEISSASGIENAARRARHAVFAGLGPVSLVLAHHRGDQAETALFNLLRGTGSRGAAGMPELRLLPGGTRLLRPMLGLSRETIAASASALGLTWIEDESNRDQRHSRNFLRHTVLPAMGSRFPMAEASIARAAAQFCEDETLLEALATMDCQAVSGPRGGLRLDLLTALGKARARNALRFQLRRAGAPAPTGDWLRAAYSQLVGARADAAPAAMLAGWSLRRYRGEVFVVAPLPAGGMSAMRWGGEQTLAWGGTRLLFDTGVAGGLAPLTLAGGEWWIRPRTGEERLRTSLHGHRRSLKNLLQEAGIPPWQRQGMPVLYDGSVVAWAPWIGVAIEYRCPPGELGTLPRWENNIDGNIGGTCTAKGR